MQVINNDRNCLLDYSEPNARLQYSDVKNE